MCRANKKVSLNVLQMMAVHVKTELLQGGNLARKEHEKLSEFKCSTGYLQKFLKRCAGGGGKSTRITWLIVGT